MMRYILLIIIFSILPVLTFILKSHINLKLYDLLACLSVISLFGLCVVLFFGIAFILFML